MTGARTLLTLALGAGIAVATASGSPADPVFADSVSNVNHGFTIVDVLDSEGASLGGVFGAPLPAGLSVGFTVDLVDSFQIGAPGPILIDNSTVGGFQGLAGFVDEPAVQGSSYQLTHIFNDFFLDFEKQVLVDGPGVVAGTGDVVRIGFSFANSGTEAYTLVLDQFAGVGHQVLADGGRGTAFDRFTLSAPGSFGNSQLQLLTTEAEGVGAEGGTLTHNVTLAPGESLGGSFTASSFVSANTEAGLYTPPNPEAEAQPFRHDRLEIVLDGTGSFDTDEDGSEIVRYSWRGPGEFQSSEAAPSLTILQSGLRTTTDRTGSLLDVFDDEGDINPLGTEAEAPISYENAAPVIAGVRVRRSGDSVAFSISGSDPDLAVNALIPDFERLTDHGIVGLPGAGSLPIGGVTVGFPVANVAAVQQAGGNVFFLEDRAGGRDELEADLSAVLSGEQGPQGEHVFLQTGSPASLVQTVDVPADPFVMGFDVQFGTGFGVLGVLLDGVTLVELMAADFEIGLAETVFLQVLDPALLGLADVELEFRLDGPAGAEALLDNIFFPGLANGGFGSGLAGWTVRTEGAASVTLAGQGAAVPEPASAALLLGALGTLGLALRRRRIRAA